MSLIDCPFCGEPTEIDVDAEGASDEPGEHVMVQDCDVCCHPINVRVRVAPDGTCETDFGRD